MKSSRISSMAKTFKRLSLYRRWLESYGNYPIMRMALEREISKMDAKLCKMIKPYLQKEVTVGEITDLDIQKAKDYPIDSFFDGKTKGILCPFHNDKNPSCSIKNNRLRCWSQCNKSFDSIAVYMKLHDKSFIESVKALK